MNKSIEVEDKSTEYLSTNWRIGTPGIFLQKIVKLVELGFPLNSLLSKIVNNVLESAQELRSKADFKIGYPSFLIDFQSILFRA
ncbi:MAG: hypothetical protein M3O09_06565 [Acidobacteriota bacterium]|nr:hypothetical protein [Acidobacteriota bacterium]